MVSEKQIAANRANSRKSTGPRTAAGKLKSAQNSFRHGLTAPLQFDPATAAKADALARALTGGDVDESRFVPAAEFAHAQIKLERIRRVRNDLMATLDLDRVAVRTLRQMASLDRYERYAVTSRRRALRNL